MLLESTASIPKAMLLTYTVLTPQPYITKAQAPYISDYFLLVADSFDRSIAAVSWVAGLCLSHCKASIPCV